jgi:hypothetical protein
VKRERKKSLRIVVEKWIVGSRRDGGYESVTRGENKSNAGCEQEASRTSAVLWKLIKGPGERRFLLFSFRRIVIEIGLSTSSSFRRQPAATKAGAGANGGSLDGETRTTGRARRTRRCESSSSSNGTLLETSSSFFGTCESRSKQGACNFCAVLWTY